MAWNRNGTIRTDRKFDSGGKGRARLRCTTANPWPAGTGRSRGRCVRRTGKRSADAHRAAPQSSRSGLGGGGRGRRSGGRHASAWRGCGSQRKKAVNSLSALGQTTKCQWLPMMHQESGRMGRRRWASMSRLWKAGEVLVGAKHPHSSDGAVEDMVDHSAGSDARTPGHASGLHHDARQKN